MTSKKTKKTRLPVAMPDSLELAGDRVVPLQYFHNEERHPKGDGPWNDEADKIGWVDEPTGIHCIILRERDGTLSGFAGVGPDHPLYGFEADAVPSGIGISVHGGDAVPSGIGISVHGGLNYAKPCEANVPEQISVCHVPSNAELRRTRARMGRNSTKDEFGDRDLWWFGFTTDHEGDYVPIHGSANRFDGIEIYRDQDFVYREVVKLASQLSAVGGSSEMDDALHIDGPIAMLGPAREGSDDDGQ